MNEQTSTEALLSLHLSLNPRGIFRAKHSEGYNWTRSIWTGGWNSYTGTATANKGATLLGLAEMITGDPNDWKEIAKSSNIQAGQKIFVKPLLKKLELMLRVRVVKATEKFYADFGYLTVAAGDDNSKNINVFFDRDSDPSSDCNGAIGIVMSKGLIDTTSDFEYNLLNLNDLFGILLKKKGTLGSMLTGDSAWIQNYSDYLEQVQDNPDNMGAYQAENVIKVARNKFWGHIGASYRESVKTPLEWEIKLREAYNQIADRKRTDKIPGHDGDVRFLNVADLAMKLFDVRRSNRR